MFTKTYNKSLNLTFTASFNFVVKYHKIKQLRSVKLAQRYVCIGIEN
jgi:hypothetical protein